MKKKLKDIPLGIQIPTKEDLFYPHPIEEWAVSPEGQQLIGQVSEVMRRVGMTLDEVHESLSQGAKI